MVKRVFMLMGPLIDRPVSGVADADAAAAVADGWGRDITSSSQPFDSSGILPKAAWPASLRSWLTRTWGVALPGAVTAACLSISKANPTVITLSAADAAKFVNGDKVTFASTGITALDNAGTLTVAGRTGNTFTVAVDLSTIPATVTNTGTVTKP